MHITKINEKETMNLTKKQEGYVEGFIGRKGRRKLGNLY